MSDENFELEVFKNLDKKPPADTKPQSPKPQSFHKPRHSNNAFYIVYYCKKSSDDIRALFKGKILNFKDFLKIENKDISNITHNNNVFFLFYNFEKSMIRALMQKETVIPLSNANEVQIKLMSKNR